ncbi:MAG TPA: FAD-dependent oxidoreductase [Gemmatimonadaceae bacterium]|nr:FAD-dependent oxidoreductase [Gemmatimonadaceae bacterium]
MPQYDLIVIGGGTAGLVAAAGSAGIGARVALVERERLGGECLWTGCVPSKALIAAARAAHEVRTGRRFGVEARESHLDFGCVMRWVRQAQQRIAPHDSPERFRGLGVDVIQGEARFAGERTVLVDGRALTAKRVVIATGSSPAVPPIDGLKDVPYLTNETIFSLERQPEALLVLGGGAIGLELAQAFARLGTTVHVLEAESQLLPREDHELAALLGERLRAEGVQLHLGANVTRVERPPRGDGVRVTTTNVLDGGTSTLVLEGDALLVSTGRVPRLSALELGTGGVEAGKTGVTVDESLRTTARGVWAAGDCVGPLRFTHVADYQARLVIRNAFFPFRSKADYAAVPWVTFTEPELAHVGLTEQEAREHFGDRVRVWRRPFDDVDRAITDGETAGMVKLVTDTRGKILGGHVLGHGAGNMVGEITLAMTHGISAHALGGTIHPYPTYSEAIKQAAESYTKSRFTGVLKRMVNWYVRR